MDYQYDYCTVVWVGRWKIDDGAATSNTVDAPQPACPTTARLHDTDRPGWRPMATGVPFRLAVSSSGLLE